MNKVFNRLQTLKSSENCDKYSKRFLYKNLAGGTATTGRECGEALEIEGVITRRTSVRRGYLPEQATHANKESLFASVTCFMRLPRRIQRMLLVMTIPALALIFTLSATAESRAEDVIPTSGTCNSTGTCLWNLDESGKLSISGSGSIGTYVTTEDSIHFKENQPWKELKDKITSVDIQGVNNISFALFRSYGNITDVNIGDSVKKIGDRAFDNDYLETVIIPASVTYVGYDAFRTRTSKDVIFFDNESMQTWSADAFNDRGGPKDTYYCFGNIDSCSDKLKKFVDVSSGGNCNSIGCAIIKAIKVATEDQCKGNYYWSGTSCNNKKSGIKCDENWKRNEDFCNRIRYTPAEAAKVLRDDNTNEVTITFKK